jgi:hypothetical protein
MFHKMLTCFLAIILWQSNAYAQSYQVTYGNASKLKSIDYNQLYEYDRKEDYKFIDKISDKTSYPFIETNISLNSGWYAFQAFVYDGRKIEYSTRGEKQKHQECLGDICLILTDRNFLAISNFVPEWSKSAIHNEEIFKTKLGSKAAFIVTERNVYLYNGFLNEWQKFGLEAESVTGVSNKNELALIITTKRIFAIHLPTNQMEETSTALKPISRFEIKSDIIDFFSYDRVFQYHAKLNQITELRLDK